MSVTTVGAMLRHAREEKGLSLDEIAQATRINRKALEAIENDLPLKLPPTYVKAFSKAFAQQVGLDPKEIVKLVEGEHAAPPETGHGQSVSRENEPASRGALFSSSVEGGRRNRRRQIKGLILFSSLSAVGLLASLLWLQRDRTIQNVQEIPFPEAMKEQESKQLPPGWPSGTDSLRRVTSPEQKQVAIDSLTLEGVAIESTWVRLSKDSAATQEFSVPPQLRMKWRAAKSFTLTVGNSGGMYFTLNGVRLGRLGQTNKPVKDIFLSRETLEQPHKEQKTK